MIETLCTNTIPRPTLPISATLALATIGVKTLKAISSTIKTTIVKVLKFALRAQGRESIGRWDSFTPTCQRPGISKHTSTVTGKAWVSII